MALEPQSQRHVWPYYDITSFGELDILDILLRDPLAEITGTLRDGPDRGNPVLVVGEDCSFPSA